MFTARYALSPYITQIRFVFRGLNESSVCGMGIHAVFIRFRVLQMAGSCDWGIEPSGYVKMQGTS